MTQSNFELKAIVAVAENHVIGRDNDLIWKLSSDLKYFKEMTSGHCVICGRRSYESIGRPLPHRTNIIITRDTTYQAEGCVVVASLKEAIEHARSIEDQSPFIIGGGQIYNLALDHVNTLYYTEVHAEFQGDTFFPELDSQWVETSRISGEKTDKDQCEFTFVTYSNKSPKPI